MLTTESEVPRVDGLCTHQSYSLPMLDVFMIWTLALTYPGPPKFVCCARKKYRRPATSVGNGPICDATVQGLDGVVPPLRNA